MLTPMNRRTPPPPANNTPKPRVALIYTRVSTGQQAAEGVSLDAQEAQCRFLAERTQMPVAGVFSDEGVSGSKAPNERSGLSALLAKKAELEAAGSEVVLVTYDFSRVSRSVADLLDLVDPRRGSVLLSTVKEGFDVSTPSGKLMRTMLAAINEFNRDMTIERTKDALAHVKAEIRADLGAGRTPAKRLGQKPVEIITQPEVVQVIYHAMAIEKLSQRRTVDRLNHLGLPKPKGAGRWNLDAVQRVIKAMQAGKFDLRTGRPVGVGAAVGAQTASVEVVESTENAYT